MSSKTKTTQTNTHGYMNPPSTTATTNLQAMVNEPVDYSTPIRAAYGKAENQANRTFNNPQGGYTTQAVRDSQQHENQQMMSQNMGIDLANAAQQSSGDKFNRQATVAQFTNPNLVQTGGTSETRTPFNWMSLAQMGAGAGSAALM